ncbi:proteasome maturation protein-like [Rhopilema esculentum]|uniref:proteasome maturation protein-like n=1 Tax=Rhopilema esculentum TaxID=499914 RepID=UPI0031D4DD2D
MLCKMAEGKRFMSLLPSDGYSEESFVKPGVFGIHDTLRDGITSVRGQSVVAHPLEFSEKNYYKNKQKQEFTALRSTQGLHMPMKLKMERTILSKIQRLPGLESSRISLRTVIDEDELGFDDMLCGPRHSYSLVSDREAFERQHGLLQ